MASFSNTVRANTLHAESTESPKVIGVCLELYNDDLLAMTASECVTLKWGTRIWVCDDQVAFLSATHSCSLLALLITALRSEP